MRITRKWLLSQGDADEQYAFASSSDYRRQFDMHPLLLACPSEPRIPSAFGLNMVTEGPRLVRNGRKNRSILHQSFPAEVDAERFIIGGILQSKNSNATLARVRQIIEERSFYFDKYRMVFSAMLGVGSRGLALNIITVAAELKQRDQLKLIGSLADLADGMPEIHHIESFCRLVAEAAQRRTLYSQFDDLQKSLLGGERLEDIATRTNTVVQILNAATSSVFDIDEIKSVCAFSREGISYVVDAFLPEGSVNAFTGDAGAGKSTFATALGGHVACGKSFLGRTSSRRKVLILDKENPAPVVRERLGRLGLQDGGDLKIWGAWDSKEVPDPASGPILNWVTRTDPKPLIIVDSFIAFLQGADENDSSTVRSFMDQLRRLADLGATVVVLHHTGKGESTRDFRGSSDFKASLDCGFTITSTNPRRLERISLRAFKTRLAVDSELVIDCRDGQFVDRPKVQERETQQLTELLQQHPGINANTFEKLAVERGLGRDRARRFLSEGATTGAITCENGPKNTHRHYLVRRSCE